MKIQKIRSTIKKSSLPSTKPEPHQHLRNPLIHGPGCPPLLPQQPEYSMVNDAAALAGTSREAMLVREMEVPVPWGGSCCGGWRSTLPWNEQLAASPWKLDGWLEDVYISYLGPVGPIFRGLLAVSFRECRLDSLPREVWYEDWERPPQSVIGACRMYGQSVFFFLDVQDASNILLYILQHATCRLSTFTFFSAGSSYHWYDGLPGSFLSLFS